MIKAPATHRGGTGKVRRTATGVDFVCINVSSKSLDGRDGVRKNPSPFFTRSELHEREPSRGLLLRVLVAGMVLEPGSPESLVFTWWYHHRIHLEPLPAY